jgi:uncharacterized protein (TIGR02246 family)
MHFLSFCRLALLLAIGLPSIGRAQSPEPHMLVQSFATAWNSHDADAMGKLFSAQADWVTAPGTRVKGRTAIRDFLAQEHKTWARTTTMTPSNAVVRFVSPDVAVILFEWEISAALDSSGKAAAPSRGNNLFVANRQAGYWTVTAGQVASQRPQKH